MHDEPLAIPGDQLSEVVSALPNDQGICLDVWETKHFCKVIKLNARRMAEWNADESKFHVVCMAIREIMCDYSQHIEKTYFPPMTEQNHDFKFSYYRWEDVVFIILTVPIDKRHLMFIGASDLNMRLADGVPHIISCGKAHNLGNWRKELPPVVRGMGIDPSQITTFPLNSDRTYTLEPIYAAPGPHLAGMGTLKEAPLPPKPTVIDEMLERFQRRKRDGKRRNQ
jgi:hypothetical protein